MIIGYFGLPGTGKTAGMVAQACEDLKNNKKIITNVPIIDYLYNSKKEGNYSENVIESMYNESNATICIDEASLVLSSNVWNKIPPQLLIKFAQVRKYGLNIYYTSQGWTHLAKRLRDLTNWVVKCDKNLIGFKYNYLDPEYYAMRVQRNFMKDYIKKTKIIPVWKHNKLFKSFNTMHMVHDTYLHNL